jgi:pimeloyl-ACP methyl ester carboxylesterase
MDSIKEGTILFLHGFTQNAIIFEKRIKTLLKALKENFNYDIVIPNAPHVIENSNIEEEVKRGWLYLNENDKMNADDFVKEELIYLGLEETLESIMKINTEDVKCIIAFSQGSLVATFLCALICHDVEWRKRFMNMKCVLITSGFIEPRPLNKEVKDIIFAKELDIPSLHVIGENDVYIVPEKSKKAAGLFKDAKIHLHNGKHYLPTSKDDLVVFVNFLKKHLN